MTPIIIVLIILIILYLTYVFANEKPLNSPPTIWRLPIWGSYWVLLWGNYKFPYETIIYYMRKYNSKILGLWVGPLYSVVVNDYDGVKEVLTRKEFDGRLHELYPLQQRAFGDKYGIFFNDGRIWQEQRRFALRHLRDFGLGRRHVKFENALEQELKILIDTIKYGPINDTERNVINGNRVHFPTILFPLSTNLIWQLLTGERYDRSEHDVLRKVCYAARRFQAGGDTTGRAISITGWLSYFGNLFGYKDFIEGNQEMINFIMIHLEKIKQNNIANEPKGFLEFYWQEMNGKARDDENYSEKQLLMIATDFMFPALSAIPTIITHCIKYMMRYPKTLKIVHEEIDSIVGKKRIPHLDDMKDMPYTVAMIREVMRIEPLAPWGVIHKCLETTTLRNYTVSAGSPVVTNLAALSCDKDFWGDPEVFRPERFFNDDGSLGKDLALPFGFGRRVCAGETYSKFLLFIVTTTLLQQFNFEMIEGEPFGFDDKISGLIVQPKFAWIHVSDRF